MLAILFISVSLIASIRCGCPLHCNCTDNAVDCINNNLESVPYMDSLTNNPVIIDLSGNSISIIATNDFSFDKNQQVKEIYLNHSEVITIEEQAFDELFNLQELYLADNYLSTLPVDFIANNTNMLLLDLSSNYFEAMPKIKSKTLEVLAVANAAMSEISKDSLEHLTSLRILLIQQNNLKHIDATIFDKMPDFAFVRMAYNPWSCDCKTAKLFEYLTGRNIVDISEPVQCLTAEKTFVNIYDQEGITKLFQEQCDSQSAIIPQRKPPEAENLIRIDWKTTKDTIPVEESDFSGSEMFYSIVLVVSIVVSLIIGALFGFLVTRKYMLIQMRPTSSTKQLLKYPA